MNAEGCENCDPAPRVGGYGHCECECHGWAEQAMFREADNSFRWTVDCWVAGCGWSQVGFVVSNLAVTAARHREERHCHDDE